MLSEEIEKAIQVLRRRITEFEDIAQQQSIDVGRLHAVKASMINDLRQIFGEDSKEFQSYENWDMYDAPRQFSMGFQNPARAAQRDEQAYRPGIKRTIDELSSIVRGLEEKRAAPG